MDELPEEFQHLRQDYDGLAYPGDLPGDVGLVPARPAQRDGWKIGPGATSRWAGLTAAAAVVALVAGGVWHAVSLSESPLAIVPKGPARVAVTSPPVVVRSTPNASSPTASTVAAAVDDSIPLWSDIDSEPAVSTVAAGLPSESLILPTLSEVQAEKTSAKQAKTQSKS